MFDKAARIRTGTLPGYSTGAVTDPRVSVDLAHLRRLEGRARTLSFLPRQPAGSALNGRHASFMRGRGLNFEELREYLPADDIRSIDWKVTARTGKPYVRVFTEERDRPTLIVVDQRMSMYFGSVLNMKSVTAAECAALAAFRVLDQGDRVGGIVFSDDSIAEIRPKRSRSSLNVLLSTLAHANAQLKADAPNVTPVSLNRVLKSVGRIAPRNHLIIIFSDFDIIDEQTRKLLRGMSLHNDLVLGLITDPAADNVPRDIRMVISDGDLQANLDTRDVTTHQKLSSMLSDRLREILDFRRTLGVPVLPLSSAEDSLSQMRRLMGLAPK